MAALEEGVVTPDFKVHCSGGGTFYGRYFKCHLKGGHGVVDMRHAIEKSCNVYFYTLGNMLGVDRMHKWATRLGLGVKSGIDLPNEIEGIMPSTEWKRKRYNEKWYAGRDDLGGDRAGPGVGDADLAGGDDGDGGQRRHARSRRAWSRRYDDGQGWKDLDAAAGARDVPLQAVHLQRRARRAVDGRQRRRHRRARAHSPACDVSGQDRHGAGHLAHRPQGGAQLGARTCATTAGSCSSRRATTPRSPA